MSDANSHTQVLDPRTRLILFKLLSSNVISSIHGCISTGKEANVYYATRPDGSEAAIKIYKTSILVFKDRDRYVSGEFRFRSGYARSNPRKMVKMWAEKETRNLKRLAAAGIPCPVPFLLRLHVLAMDFIGEKGGVAAPRLKDAGLSRERLSAAYLETASPAGLVMHHTSRSDHSFAGVHNAPHVPVVPPGARGPVGVQPAVPPRPRRRHRCVAVGGDGPPPRPGVPAHGRPQRDRLLRPRRRHHTAAARAV